MLSHRNLNLLLIQQLPHYDYSLPLELLTPPLLPITLVVPLLVPIPIPTQVLIPIPLMLLQALILPQLLLKVIPPLIIVVNFLYLIAFDYQ